MHKQLWRVAIQRNPISGAGRRDLELMEMVQGLKEAGLKPYLFSDREKLAHHLKDPKFRENLLCIVAAGGDGTVDDLINRYPGIPLAIFAMGTENLVAKHCLIPQRGRAVAQMIAQRKVRRIDLGLAGHRRFAVMASCGFDAEVVSLAHASRVGRITKWHYVRPILNTLWSRTREKLQIHLGDDQPAKECELAIISNIPRYALGLPICPLAEDNDGLFDICLVHRSAVLNLIHYAMRGSLLGRIQANGIEHLRTDYLTVKAFKPVSIQADGDPIGQTPLEFRILPGALELIVPESLATGDLSTGAG